MTEKKTKHPGGRPRGTTRLRLDPDLGSRVIEAVRVGNFIRTAAQFAGLAPSTVFLWIAKGKEEKEGPFHDFAVALEKARAEAEAAAVVSIRQAFSSDWRAAAFYLEHANSRSRWYKNSRVDVNMMSKEDLESALKAISSQLDSGGEEEGDYDPE